jgi:heme oxygenase (mycobilin-producing)
MVGDGCRCGRRVGLAGRGGRRENDTMTVIKINAITVPEGSGDEVANRFATRAGTVDGQDGFEGFELLRPTDGRHTWLVVTRWRDEASFAAWVSSPAFAHGHRGVSATGGQGGPAGGGQGGPAGGGQGARPPMAMEAELWSFEPAVGSSGAG